MKNVTPKHFKFSGREIFDLFKAWVALTIAFSITRAFRADSFESFVVAAISSAVAVGLAFLLHEIAHKYVAIKYRCEAEFRAENSMLLMMIFISFMGIIMAAPGAVQIRGHISRSQYGKISLAGPASNIALAVLSFLVIILSSGLVSTIASFSFFINSWLALFNMIPFGMFDGRKIMAWDKQVYYVTLGIAITFVALSQFF